MHLAAALLLDDNLQHSKAVNGQKSAGASTSISLSLSVIHTHCALLVSFFHVPNHFNYTCIKEEEDLDSRVPTGRSGFQILISEQGQTELYELFKISRAHFMELF